MKRLLIVIAAIMLLASSTVALAYTYATNILVSDNTSTSYLQLPIVASVNITYLVDNYFIQSTGNDTSVETGGTILPHMLASDRLLTVTPLEAGSTKLLSWLWSNNSTEPFSLITGYSGNVTVTDNDTLELGSQFTVEVKGWIDADNGTSKNLAHKYQAFSLYVSPTVSGNITAYVENVGTAQVSVTGVTSAEHTIKVWLENQVLSLQIDSGTPVTVAWTEAVQDNGESWHFFQNNAMPYVEYIKIWN